MTIKEPAVGEDSQGPSLHHVLQQGKESQTDALLARWGGAGAGGWVTVAGRAWGTRLWWREKPVFVGCK